MLKWIFDRVMAAAGLLALWPVLAVVAVLIKVRNAGSPVIFRPEKRWSDTVRAGRLTHEYYKVPLHDRGTRKELGVGGRREPD